MSQLGFVKFNDCYINPHQIDYIKTQEIGLFDKSKGKETVIVAGGSEIASFPQEQFDIEDIVSKIQKSIETGETIDLLG